MAKGTAPKRSLDALTFEQLLLALALGATLEYVLLAYLLTAP
jgi:hypothetical protein